jgi:hypothetical protein
MAESVQDVWDRFERWEGRYLKACARRIGRMCKKGFSDVPARFLLMAAELGCDPVLDLDHDEDHLNARIERKTRFLRAYLADISHDGGRFMSQHSKFLQLQFPGRCLTAMGVWLGFTPGSDRSTSVGLPNLNAGFSSTSKLPVEIGERNRLCTSVAYSAHTPQGIFTK